MDFRELKQSAAREIAMAFGVPPMLLGLPGDATYANYREANRALWRLTVLPLCAKILGALAQGLSGWFGAAELRVDQIGRASCRESVSVRVDLGGRRIMKKQIKRHSKCVGIYLMRRRQFKNTNQP